MVLSYSAIAQPSASTPAVISIASPAELTASASSSSSPAASTVGLSHDAPSAAGPSRAGPSNASGPGIKHLILDAGPLLSLAPIRHLAKTFHTTPMVLAELRDPKAREHWERLKLSGVDVRVEKPSVDVMVKVTAFARKTGDIAVLSATDLSVIALTYQHEVAENGEVNIRTELVPRSPQSFQAGPRCDAPANPAESTGSGSEEVKTEGHAQEGPTEENYEDDRDGEEEPEEDGDECEGDQGVEVDVDEVTRSIDQILLDPQSTEEKRTDSSTRHGTLPATADPDNAAPAPYSSGEAIPDEDDESDGGEWITPSNVNQHRSHDLGLLPTENPTAESGPIAAACMTGDFAVQNVLLGMGLGLVGEGGKRISKVKSFVLRCHACFKICKDNTKRFCPSCGNPSLLRTTVTVNAKTGQQKIHLKKNFQYHLRGTKFTIPDAKPGRAKGQQKGGTGLILREDQAEWQNAVKSQQIKRDKEERRAAKGALEGWNNPDWLPEIITVGMSGKGRHGPNGMPTIGHGRRNPNQARKKR